MNRPFSVGLSADLVPRVRSPFPDEHRLDPHGLHYETSPLFWTFFGTSSLLRPQMIFANTEEEALELGRALIEYHLPRQFGWKNHETAATDISTASYRFIKKRIIERNRRLRLFVGSGIVCSRFSEHTFQRFAVSGVGIGATEDEAFQDFKEGILDQRFPSATRIGYVVRLKMVPTEHIFAWKEYQKESFDFRIAA